MTSVALLSPKSPSFQKESQQAKSIAQKLFTEIDSLEDEILESKRQVREIEDRGFFKRTFSSSSKDLSAVAKTQNSINRRMMDLIQETIRLNMLSYAGLVCLMEEMRKGIEGSLKDANGRIIQLGSEGRDLAETATDIISGILDTSKGTQGRIDQHEEAIKQIDQELEAKDQLDSRQDEAINQLDQQIKLKEKLDEKQDAKIQYLLDQSKVNQSEVATQNDNIEKLSVQFSLLNNAISSLESCSQQHQNNVNNQILKLEKSLRTQRLFILSLTLISIYLIGKALAII
jgi:chromosome segregation ATPase